MFETVTNSRPIAFPNNSVGYTLLCVCHGVSRRILNQPDHQSTPLLLVVQLSFFSFFFPPSNTDEIGTYFPPISIYFIDQTVSP